MSAADEYIDMGDVVEHKMNPDVFGIVIGIAGTLIYIRTSPTLVVLSFHEWELRTVGGEGTPPAQEDDETNVVRVDFTQQQDLRGVKPAGRA